MRQPLMIDFIEPMSGFVRYVVPSDLGRLFLNGERLGFRVEITISGIDVGFCAGHGDDHDLGLGRLEIRVLAFRHDGVPGQQKQTPLSLPRTFLCGRSSSSTPVLGSYYEVKADTDCRLRGQG